MAKVLLCTVLVNHTSYNPFACANVSIICNVSIHVFFLNKHCIDNSDQANHFKSKIEIEQAHKKISPFYNYNGENNII